MTTESISELAQATIEVLQLGPKRFKELYPLIAERLPQACPHNRHNGTYAVNVSNMSWLKEVANVLKNVAMNRGDVWYLKDTTLSKGDSDRITDTSKPSPLEKRHHSTVAATLDQPRGDSVPPSTEPKASLKLEMETMESKAAEHESRSAAARKAWITIRAKKAARIEQAGGDKIPHGTSSGQKAIAGNVGPGPIPQNPRLSDCKEQHSNANEPIRQKQLHGTGVSLGKRTNETREKTSSSRRAPGPPPSEAGTPLKRGAALQVMVYPRAKTKAVLVRGALKAGRALSSFLIRAGLEKIARDQGCEISDLVPESELRLYI